MFWSNPASEEVLTLSSVWVSNIHVCVIHMKLATLLTAVICWSVSVIIWLSLVSLLPSIAPYSEANCIFSSRNAWLNMRVTRVWTLFVEVLKFLQIWAMSRDAKSRSAQWLSNSGLMHNCLLTMHVATEGINSCSCNDNSRTSSKQLTFIVQTFNSVFVLNSRILSATAL